MNNIKKTYISLFMVLVMVVPQVSLAAAISLKSASSKTEANKTFNVSVYINPSSVASYTVQANIKFPADLVSVESFNYSSGWFPVNQPGYDFIDNTQGKIVKTAGYPNGFSKETLLGTIVFKSKKAGAVVISTDKESYILDVDSNNILSTYGNFPITSSAPVVTTPKTPVVATTPKVVPTKTTPDVVKKDTVKNPEPVIQPTQVVEEKSNVVLSENNNSNKKMVLFTVIIFGIISTYLGFH